VVILIISDTQKQAIYPTLFLEYVTSVSGTKSSISFFHRFLLIAILTIFLSLLNYRGLEIVGNASLVVCIIAMSPFVLMTIIGAPQVVVERWFQMPEVQEDGESLFDDTFQTSAGPLPLLSMAGIMWRP
jgi:amino acid transporter